MIKGRNNRLATSGLAVLLSSITLTGCVSDPEKQIEETKPEEVIFIGDGAYVLREGVLLHYSGEGLKSTNKPNTSKPYR